MENRHGDAASLRDLDNDDGGDSAMADPSSMVAMDRSLGGWQGPTTATVVGVSGAAVLTGVGVGFFAAWGMAGGGKLADQEKGRVGDGARLAARALAYGTALTALTGAVAVVATRWYLNVHSWPQFADKCEEFVGERSLRMQERFRRPLGTIGDLCRSLLGNPLRSDAKVEANEQRYKDSDGSTAT